MKEPQFEQDVNQLAINLKVNRSTMTRDLRSLKSSNNILRKGSAKGGF